MLDAARTDIQDHLVGGHAVDRDHARGRVRRELLGHHGVDRQHDLAAIGLRLGHDLARGRQEIVLAQGFADGMPERGQEGIGHGAADDEASTLASRLPSRSSLVEILAPPTIAATGRVGVSSTFVSASSSSCMVRPA